tara:strand:+ start:15873 stop:17705 length:1833 start_codon:yes stop_codon:yes gene_type:complete
MGMKQWMTFGIKTEGAEKAKTDIDGVATASKNAEESQEGLNDSIEQGTGALDKMSGGAIGAFKGVVSGVKKAVLGMKTLKGAMMATGIGALVVIVGSLVSYFTKTKRGAEMLQVATAALGAVTGKVTDVFSHLGEMMIGIFSDPKEAVLGLWDTIKSYFIDKFNKVIESVGLLGSAFKKLFAGDFTGALSDAAEGSKGLFMELTPLGTVIKATTAIVKGTVSAVKDFVSEVKEAVSTAAALEKRAIALKDAQRELGVEFAQTRQAIREQKLIAEDLNKTFDERIEAAEAAGAMEADLAAKSLALAQEAVDIKRAQNDITESTAEDLQDLADLEIALAQAQTESLGKQTELMMKLNALYVAQAAEIKAAEDAEEARITAMIARQTAIDDIVEAGRAREIQKIKDHWIEQKRLAGLEGQILVGAADAQRMQIDAVNKKWDAKEIKDIKLTTQQKLGIASGLIGSLMALNSAMAGSSEKEQKRAFQRNKKMGIVSALINTAGAIIGAINPAAGGIPLPAGLPGAIAAAASGAAQIATISKSRFSSPDTTSPTAPTSINSGGGGALGEAANNAPQLDLSFLGEGAGGSIQAYVISEQVTNQQQADQIVIDQTTL